MIEGYLPGLVRVDPVGVAPAEVVRLAARCERLEAALVRIAEADRAFLDDRAELGFTMHAIREAYRAALDAALVAAGATGKAGT